MHPKPQSAFLTICLDEELTKNPLEHTCPPVVMVQWKMGHVPLIHAYRSTGNLPKIKTESKSSNHLTTLLGVHFSWAPLGTLVHPCFFVHPPRLSAPTRRSEAWQSCEWLQNLSRGRNVWPAFVQWLCLEHLCTSLPSQCSGAVWISPCQNLANMEGCLNGQREGQSQES